MLENALSGLTSGVGSVADAVTLSDPGTHDFAYEPRTDAGKEIAALTAEEGAKVGEVYDKVAGEGPLATTVKERVPQALAAAGTVAGGGVAASRIPGRAPKAPVKLGDDPVANMRAAGYKLRPSDVRSTDPSAKTPGIRREGLQDSANLRQDIGLHNQTVTTRLAADEIGAPRKNKISPGDFEKLREPHFKTYEDVETAVNASAATPEFTNAVSAARARTHFRPTDKPTTTQVIAALRRQERKKARANDVATNKDGIADRDAADALEAQLEARLKATGNEKLFTAYQESRMALAKLNDVQSVTKGGQVDAVALRNLGKRGVPLSGRLKLIAESAEHAENVMKPARRLTGVDGGPSIDSKAGAIRAGAKAVARKLPGMDVRRRSFQNKFGREANEAEQRDFGKYGKTPRAEKPKGPPQREMNLKEGPPPFDGLEAPPGAPLGRSRPESVEFEQTGGVVPSRAQTLSGALGLEPDAVPGAVELPPAPSRFVAETPPSTPTDGLPFKADMPLAAQLMDELGLEPPRVAQSLGPDTVEWVPPSLADLLIDAETNRVMNLPPTHTGQAELPAFAPQRPKAELKSPPGRVGKPKKGKK